MEEVELPETICLTEHRGDWHSFINTIFEIFKADFMTNAMKFRNKIIRLKHHPRFQDRPCTFYHMTHTGDIENEKLPDLERCERLPWARPVIEKCDAWDLKIWPQVRGNNKNRLCIWLELDGEPDYFVVLEVRENYILPWTAFVITHNHQKRKKLKEYQEYLKAKAAQ